MPFALEESMGKGGEGHARQGTSGGDLTNKGGQNKLMRKSWSVRRKEKKYLLQL